MLSHRAPFRLRPHLWPVLIVVGITIWSGWPVLVHSYGYNDDYHLLLRARRGELNWFRNEFSEGGRYLLSPLMVFAYKTVQEVSNLAWMRGFGLLGTMLLALGAYAILVRDIGKRPPAIAGAIMISLTPATATWLGWAACFVFPFIAFIALLSGRWAWHFLNEPWKWQTAAKSALCIAILILCFSFYQPNGPFWIVGFWMGYWFDKENSPIDTPREKRFRPAIPLAIGSSLLISAAFLYFLLFRVIADAMSLQGQAKRGAISLLDIPDRFAWLGQEYPARILAHWAGLVSPVLAQTAAILGGILIIGAIFQRYRKHAAKGVIGGAIVTVLVFVLSFLPMLVASDRMIAFRVMGPPLAIAGLLILESIRRVASESPANRWLPKTKAINWILVVLALANAGLFRTYLYRGFVEPSSQEYSALRAQIHERIDAFPESIVYRFPPEQIASSALFTPFAEFGPYSSYQKWVIPSFLQLILEERFGNDRPRVIVTTRATSDTGAKPPVISALEAVTGPSLEHRMDPYWGPIDVHAQGWIYSEWFGVLKNDGFPEIKHAEHHYLRCNPREDGDETYWFLDWQTRRWFSTTAETYPEVYFPDTDQTVTFQTIISPLRRFHDAKTNEWLVFF